MNDNIFNFLNSSYTFEQFIEARRNPELNPKISAYKALLPYKDDPDIYISFTKVDKIGINPQSNYNTPLGIYCYPLEEVWKEYNFDQTKSPGQSVPFAGDNPFIWILRKKKGVKFIEDLYTSYTSKDYDEDYKKLEEYAKDKFSLKVLEVNARKTARHQSPSGIMWNLTRLIAEFISGENRKAMVQWNTLLYRVLGYYGIADKSGRGIIHPSEPMQAVFLTTRGFDVEGQILNKDYEGVGLGSNEGKFIEWLRNFYSKYNKISVSFSSEIKDLIIENIYPIVHDKYHLWGDRTFPIKDDQVKKIINMLIFEDEIKGRLSSSLASQLLDNINIIVEKATSYDEMLYPDKDDIYNLIEQWVGKSFGIVGPLRILKGRIMPKITTMSKEELDSVFKAFIDFLFYYYTDPSDFSKGGGVFPKMNKKETSMFINWVVEEYNL